MAIIGVAGAFLSRLVASRIGMWIVSALLFFGLQMAVNKFVAGPVIDGLRSAFGGMTSDVLGWVSFLNIDRALTILLSAYATASTARVFLTKKAS